MRPPQRGAWTRPDVRPSQQRRPYCAMACSPPSLDYRPTRVIPPVFACRRCCRLTLMMMRPARDKQEQRAQTCQELDAYIIQASPQNTKSAIRVTCEPCLWTTSITPPPTTFSSCSIRLRLSVPAARIWGPKRRPDCSRPASAIPASAPPSFLAYLPYLSHNLLPCSSISTSASALLLCVLLIHSHSATTSPSLLCSLVVYFPARAH